MSRQDPHEIAELVRSLEHAKGGKSKGGKRGGFSCKKSTFLVVGSNNISVDSWRFQDWDYKRDDLPTYARGLFTTKTKSNTPEIAIRGYDKFFNVDEVHDTEWENVESNTTGPYELSVKENGCIIFISGLEDGTLLVCSKHSTGAREDVNLSHAIAGERWVAKHLESVGKTTKELAKELRAMNVTAVGELCDDTFEEHVLEYPPDKAGLYLHGINFNLPEFATLSGPEVHQFADSWGFKKAEYIIIQGLDEVKDFLGKCAETGSWGGRDTEGFVIRCKMRDKHGEPYRDWFFKYKFEEPYLMYRQWRECTKAIITGKPPKFKKHKKITDEYLLYARQQLAKDPKLGKEYNQNHGIIAMRDGFLAEKGQKGADIIAQERAEENGDDAEDATKNVVLVPIATLGCGKTTVASAMVKLFDIGHIQNDNIEGKGNRPARFAMGVTNAMALHKAVIADRNNHQKREREQIVSDVLSVVPTAKFVALHYVHEPKGRMLDSIRRVTRRRILERGDNHQTIHAASKNQEEIVGIMEGFLYRFQGCDTSVKPDQNFDEVIELDVSASSLENLETIVNYLYKVYPGLLGDQMPTHQDMSDAIDFALNNTVTLKHDLSKNAPRQKNKQGRQAPNGHQNTPSPAPLDLTPEQMAKRLEYFGITVSSTNITSTLSGLFANAPAEEASFYNTLKQSRRLQTEFHVTLVHRASATPKPDIWEKYTQSFVRALQSGGGKNDKQLNPSLGPARLRLERVVWNERVMAIVVRILPQEQTGDSWPCANEVSHITIGTASQDIKPKESNNMLVRWLEGNCEEPKIWEKDVPGMKVLEGTVKAVMQRGR